MKYKNVFWGLILILIGSLAIARNLDLLYFDWYRFLKLWPVIFILWGISVLPARDYVKIGLLLIVLGGATWFVVDSSVYPNDDEHGFVFNNWNYNSNSLTKYEQTFTIPWADSIKKASIDLDAAAGSFHITDTTAALVDFSQRGSKSAFEYVVKRTPENTRVKISEKHRPVFYGKSHKRVVIKLNPEPVWNINLDAGASAVKYDLSSFKLHQLNIDGGAGSFKITLGSRYPNTFVTMDAGASSILIRIPESSGCDLELSSVLSGKSLSGFQKTDDGHYQTANYDSAVNKIHLNIDAAVSSFTILRY